MPTDYTPSSDVFYNIQSKFRGGAMNLDIVNGGPQNNQVQLSTDLGASGQFWHMAHVKNTDYYTLKTQFRGENMCLDVNLPSPRPRLNSCGNFTGQHWYIDPSSSGPNYRRLTNRTQGSDMCLDVNPRDNAAEMRPCGNFSGQAWMFIATGDKTR